MAEIITDHDMRAQVLVTLDGAEADGTIDVDGIVTYIQENYGLIDIELIQHDEYWEIVRANDSAGFGRD